MMGENGMKSLIRENTNFNLPFGENAQPIPSRFPTVMLDQNVFCMQNKVADLQVRCVISLDGKVDAERMAKAVRLTLDAEPILGCRFVEQWWRPYWERRKDLNSIKNFGLVQVTDFVKELVSFMSAPVNPLTDPLVQVRILRSENDTMCIKINHMIADACGGKEYAYLLASIYRKLAEDPEYVPKPNLWGSRSLRQISKCFNFLDKLRIIRRGFRDFKRRSFPYVFWSFPSNAGTLSNKTFVIRQFGPERFRVIKEYGRTHHATMNDIMLAAFYRALFDFINPDPSVPLRLANTVDLRRHLPSGRTGVICNLSNFSFTNIGKEVGTTFEDTVVMVREDMNAMKADFLGLGDCPFVALFFKGLPFSWTRKLFAQSLNQLIKIGNTPPIFTNTGIIDSGQLIFGDAIATDAYMIGATFFPPSFGMALSSFGELLTLSISFFETAIKRQVVEHILDLMESNLPG